jgi:hypothetical protein
MDPKSLDEALSNFRHWLKKVELEDDRKFIARLVEALERVKASLGLYGTMKHQISSFEKLISDTWMNDQGAFDSIYDSWKAFKNRYASYIGGMTVNERLCEMGLMDDFEQTESRAKLESVLREVFLTHENIEAIIKQRQL